MTFDIASEFWQAIQTGDVETARELLDTDSSLAGKNFRPESLHTEGFPLYHAAKNLNSPLVKVLLDSGADPEAKLETDHPREFGMPLLNAFHTSNSRGVGNYDVVHLILDYKPSLNASPYCSTPFVDCLFNNLWTDNSKKASGEFWSYKNDCGNTITELFRNSYSNYLGDRNADLQAEVSRDSFPELALLTRAVEMGGQPSLFTLVRHEQRDLISELLQNVPTEKGTVMDWPQGRVIDNIAYAAAWCGYPKTIKACIDCGAELFNSDSAKHAINRAIHSHNCDGDIDQYFDLIQQLLKLLKERNGLQPSFENGDPFCPLHLLAEDFIQTSHYGFKCARLGTEEDAIRLAKLFLDFGFEIRFEDPRTGLNAAETAGKYDLATYKRFLSELSSNH